MKAAVLAVALVAVEAQAQGSGSEPILVLVLGPPALFSIAIDVTLLSTLVPDGTAGRGRSITGMVFASIGLVLSVICLASGFGSPFTSPWWTGISAAGVGLATGSMVLGIYGLIRGEPPVEEPPESDAPHRPERLYRPAPRPAEPPPQLFVLPFSFKL